MKLAYWYPAGTFSAWSISLGAVEALRRMGHEVRDCGIAAGSKTIRRSDYPSRAELEACDGIIVSGPEHIQPFISALYPDWAEFSVAKVGWLHETVDREDYGQLQLEPVRRMAPTIFSPAAQDDAHGFPFLPFGVDMHMFRPEPIVPRDIEVCFIGLMYPKRQLYLDRIKSFLDGVDLKVGNVQIQEDGKVHHRKTVDAYANALRRIQVFVNLPTLSQLVVTKIYEVAASGACMLTPVLKGAGACNHQYLRDNVRTYDEESPADLAEMIKALLQDSDLRERLGRQSSEEMYAEHRIELRLQRILDSLR